MLVLELPSSTNLIPTENFGHLFSLVLSPTVLLIYLLTYLLTCFYVVGVLPACMSVHHLLYGARKGQRRALSLLGLALQMVVSLPKRFKPRASGRVAGALNHWAASLVPKVIVLNTHKLNSVLLPKQPINCSTTYQTASRPSNLLESTWLSVTTVISVRTVTPTHSQHYSSPP